MRRTTGRSIGPKQSKEMLVMATRVGGGSKGSKNFGQRSLASERTASARFLKQLGRVEAQRVGSSGRQLGSAPEWQHQGQVAVDTSAPLGRRESLLRGCFLASLVGLAELSLEPASVLVARADDEPPFQLDVSFPSCDVPLESAAPAAQNEDEPAEPAPPSKPTTCVNSLGSLDVKESPTGLKYKDLLVGDGEEPPIGYQVVVNYVIMLPSGKVISSTLDSGYPADVRVGSGNLVKGIDEGILGMRSGGVRRLYVPGALSFQERLASAPGRPAVPAQSNLIVDLNLLYIPGLD